MSVRRSQVILVVILALPLVVGALTAPPFVARPSAQVANRLLGPNFPALVDSNGDGRPTEGTDERIIPTLAGATLTLNTRWNCSTADTDNQFTLSAPDSAGRYTRLSHTSGFLTNVVTPGGTTTSAGIPTSYRLDWTAFFAVGGGTLTLSDTNADGAFDRGVVNGSQPTGATLNVTLNWTYLDVTGDNVGDYISFPWSQASSVGVKTNDGCGDPDPQVFVPLADTNGDSRPDAIAADLNGNGTADPEFFTSPTLVAPATVPTMNTWGLGGLLAVLAALGLWSLHRRPLQV